MATEQRIESYKDVPTLIERGIKVVGQSPYGLVGPKGMPPEIVESIYLAFKEAMAEPRSTSTWRSSSRCRGTRTRPNTALSPRSTMSR